MEFLFLALVLLAVPFVVPIATWISVRRMRGRVVDLEDLAEHLTGRIRELESSLHALREQRRVWTPTERPEEAPVTPGPTEGPEPPPRADAVRAPEPVAEGMAPEPVPPPMPQPEAMPEPAIEPTSREEPQPVSVAADEEAALPPPEIVQEVPETAVPGTVEEPARPQISRPAFDWEGLVGVKLFSAIAGIALVLAAIFFLRYSIEHGWLQPPVRVAIGVVVAVGLLVVCELRAARRYPVTANALDAAAIAILFATFFAAHALWNLIPASVTFGLLALVTALAVLLSIRRESLFIAMLGLLGGFSTPALLSTGENRPIPLFAYLLLLNIGLAWVAQRRGWTLLSWLTVIFTTIYQWGWVLRFLHESSLPLAMGVFIVFPIASMAALAVARRGRAESGSAGDGGLERTSLISAVLPLAFVTYLAAVPEYGSRAGLLFGFLLFVDVGLLAIAIGRREGWLHGTGAVATLLTMGIWLAVSYPGSEARFVALGFTIVGSLLYLLAPLLAARLGQSIEGAGATAQFTAPLLLFALPVLAWIEPSFATPWLLVATLLLLVCAIAWTAIAAGTGGLYYIAAFFAVATQAAWSSVHLSPARLGTAVAIYTLFAAVSLGVPILARQRGRPLEPAWGGGGVLILSLALLLYLSAGSIAPAALWALALLLAILNAAIFIEGAAGGLPWLSQAGTVLSWIVLANWWDRAAGAVGVLPSLAVLTGLTLVTLGGHAWTTRRVGATERDVAPGSFRRGLYLGLTGHLFLLFLALNREWGMPPWPLFATLGVITLAVSAASLAVRAPSLHTAGTVAAAVVVSAWGATAGEQPWPAVALAASAAVSGYALAWIGVTRTLYQQASAGCAAAVLIVSEIALILIDLKTQLPFPGLLGLHAANMAVLLALTSKYSWRIVAGGASLLAWAAVLQWQASRTFRPTADMTGELWPHLLLLAGSLYAIFVAYPMIVGRRRAHDREPYVAAIVASAMLFFAARTSLRAGSLEWMLGAVPVLEGGILTVLLRQILRLEPAGERDLGRLALVAGAALAFATVAIPVQLERQWVTIGWALEGAALAWLYRRVPHKGLLAACVGLLAVVFVRLALNPEVLTYEPRGALPVLNWYLYTYSICAACCFLAGSWLSTTDETLGADWFRPSKLLPASGVILLFLLLNIEIADYFATGPALTFRFGVTVSQDLTYTIGWLMFGMVLLAAGIYQGSRGGRVAAVGLIAVTTFKCFLYDLGSLEGLYRVASFVGLALSLALVSLALQKFVLGRTATDGRG